MIPVRLSQLATELNAELVGDDITIADVSTDTRKIADDTLFIALIGERFDAHNFCQQAMDNGAKALLVSRPLPVALPQLVVKDTRIALGQVGAWVKAQMVEHHGLKTVALTGSCGKTTVKEMTAAILAQCGEVLATDGNFNNDIGVPLTLLRLTPNHEFAVIELGANHQNEIAYTTQLVKPQTALVNNLAAAHLEGFGSLEGVAKAKGEIFEGLTGEDAQGIVNLDSHDLTRWQPLLAQPQLVTFAEHNQDVDFYASEIKINPQGQACFTMHTPEGEIDLVLAIPGQHNVSNALAAAALSRSMGATLAQIKAGLTQVTSVKGRVDITLPYKGLRLIDDTYNASVASVKAAIDLLASFPSERWLVMGDMAELGPESDALHREIAEYAAERQLQQVYTFGTASRVISELNQGQHYSDKAALIAHLQSKLSEHLHLDNSEVTVLAKGARSARMEEVVSALQENKQ